MITLLTGLPGNGKGVYGIDWLKTRAEREGRAVYYSGINDCKVPGWVELDDPTQWYRVPQNSYVLIDEAQRIFRSRANGSAVPPHVSELETHRHLGLDLLLITQHPMLIDQNIRRLVGQHFHIVRKFGMQRAVVHEWQQVVTDPGRSRRDSIRHDYAYNKDIYSLYKSAEVHTVKRNIPMRYIALFIIPFLVGGLAYAAYNMLKPSAIAEMVTQQPAQELPAAGHPAPARTAAAPTLSWHEQQAPRIPDLPHTAPKYDEVTKPDKAPLPSACVEFKGGCTCYTQQATRMQTDDAVCRQIVRNGFFIDFEDKAVPKDENKRDKLAYYQSVLQSEAPAGGETVAPAPVGVPAEPEARSPSKIARESMRQSPYAFNYPGAIATN